MVATMVFSQRLSRALADFAKHLQLAHDETVSELRRENDRLRGELAVAARQDKADSQAALGFWPGVAVAEVRHAFDSCGTRTAADSALSREAELRVAAPRASRRSPPQPKCPDTSQAPQEDPSCTSRTADPATETRGRSGGEPPHDSEPPAEASGRAAWPQQAHEATARPGRRERETRFHGPRGLDFLATTQARRAKERAFPRTPIALRLHEPRSDMDVVTPPAASVRNASQQSPAASFTLAAHRGGLSSLPVHATPDENVESALVAAACLVAARRVLLNSYGQFGASCLQAVAAGDAPGGPRVSGGSQAGDSSPSNSSSGASSNDSLAPAA